MLILPISISKLEIIYFLAKLIIIVNKKNFVHFAWQQARSLKVDYQLSDRKVQCTKLISPTLAMLAFVKHTTSKTI